MARSVLASVVATLVMLGGVVMTLASLSALNAPWWALAASVLLMVLVVRAVRRYRRGDAALAGEHRDLGRGAL